MTMQKTTAEPFTDANALEDSALLAALDNSSGNVHAPDGARLVALGLATVNDKGHYHLTDDGRAAAETLRERERLLIPDDVLKIVLSLVGRASGKRTGWVARFGTFGRPYVEMVRLPHTSPELFYEMTHRGSTWVGIPFQIFSRLGGYAEHDGARIYFAPEFRPSWAPAAEHTIPGTPFTLDRDGIDAMGHADAVWSDLGHFHRVHPVYAHSEVYADPVALLFHYASRDVRVALDDKGRPRVEIIAGPDTGRAWTGHRVDIAVKAMCADMRGTPCAHGYGTGRDSCPGCDATGEEFEERYGTLLGTMPADPALSIDLALSIVVKCLAAIDAMKEG